MANLLHTKGSRTQIYKTLPSNSIGNDGDIILSQIQGRGVYLCSKVNGKWHVSNKMEELRKIDKTSIKDLGVDKLTVGTTKITKGEYDVSVGNFTLDGAGDITLDAGSGNIYVKDNGGNYTPGSDYEIATKKYVDDEAGEHFMDWYYANADLVTQNKFYSGLHNDTSVSDNIDTDLTTSGYSTTTLDNAWRMIRYARRVPYRGTITKFMVHLESTGAAADSDVEVALWWADALADDTAHNSTDNFTCDHLCTLTFDFSAASKFMTKQTTSFNATSISEGDWIFVTLRKTTSGDGSNFYAHSTMLWNGR